MSTYQHSQYYEILPGMGIPAFQLEKQLHYNIRNSCSDLELQQPITNNIIVFAKTEILTVHGQ